MRWRTHGQGDQTYTVKLHRVYFISCPHQINIENILLGSSRDDVSPAKETKILWAFTGWNHPSGAPNSTIIITCFFKPYVKRIKNVSCVSGQLTWSFCWKFQWLEVLLADAGDVTHHRLYAAHDFESIPGTVAVIYATLWLTFLSLLVQKLSIVSQPPFYRNFQIVTAAQSIVGNVIHHRLCGSRLWINFWNSGCDLRNFIVEIFDSIDGSKIIQLSYHS